MPVACNRQVPMQLTTCFTHLQLEGLNKAICDNMNEGTLSRQHSSRNLNLYSSPATGLNLTCSSKQVHNCLNASTVCYALLVDAIVGSKVGQGTGSTHGSMVSWPSTHQLHQCLCAICLPVNTQQGSIALHCFMSQ